MDKISIVTSLYRSENFIDEFYARHRACLNKLNLDYEFVFVNDGSPDQSSMRVRALNQQDQKVVLVELSRNFGQHAAMFAAMAFARGNYVCALDCDLEEAPENLEGMFKRMQADSDIDVVYGIQQGRPGGMVRGFFGKIFYLLMEWISEVKIPRHAAWQRVMTRRYVDALLLFRETEVLTGGLMALTGFRQVPYVIEKNYKGTTSYSFRRRMVLAFNSILGFSSRPLTFICVCGVLITIVAFLAIVEIVGLKLAGHPFQAGWVSLLASIWCVGGLIMFSIGMVGIYLARVFNQVKGRPLYIVKSVLGRAP
jgi:putative glycosyltransferase